MTCTLTFAVNCVLLHFNNEYNMLKDEQKVQMMMMIIIIRKSPGIFTWH